MYWGEGTCFAATSDDLVRWTPLEFDATGDRYLTYEPDGGHGGWDIHRVPGQRVLRPLLFPRRGRFDSLLVEPGPPAVRTDDGIVLIYNGANHPERRRPVAARRSPTSRARRCSTRRDPASCIARSTEPFLRPDDADEQDGQVDNVCFAQGLVLFGDRVAPLLRHGRLPHRPGPRAGCRRADRDRSGSQANGPPAPKASAWNRSPIRW